MNFADVMKMQTTRTLTENGADALNTTGSKLLDFYSVIGALRNQNPIRITRLFADAYKEDPLRATKAVFYGRDIRGGLGEREVFRILINYMATYNPEAIKPNIGLIGEYGRFDDLYSLVDTPLEKDMWEFVRTILDMDLALMAKNQPVSLLAKWLKTADASSWKTRKQGIDTALALGYTVKEYKKNIKALRKYIDIVERKMSANEWSDIDYSKVPSRASMIYKEAFSNHDFSRYSEFINKALNGEAKINAGTLYPYDLIHRILKPDRIFYKFIEDPTVEALWKQLPNYIEGENSVIVIADTSSSMTGRPIETAIGLAVYFAERNQGPYKDLWMNFSSNPSYQVLKGQTLAQKIQSIDYSNWEGSTDLEAAFELILETAIKNYLKSEDLPKALVIISDMEINCSTTITKDEWMSFYDDMKEKYAVFGYTIPNIIFWNVESRHDVFHVDKDRPGVQLASGSSASTFKNVIDAIGMNPVEAMIKTLDSKRYLPITIER